MQMALFRKENKFLKDYLVQIAFSYNMRNYGRKLIEAQN